MSAPCSRCARGHTHLWHDNGAPHARDMWMAEPGGPWAGAYSLGPATCSNCHRPDHWEWDCPLDD